MPEKYQFMRDDVANGPEPSDEEGRYLTEVLDEARTVDRYNVLAATAEQMRSVDGNEATNRLLGHFRALAKPHWQRVHELTQAHRGLAAPKPHIQPQAQKAG